MGGRVNRTAIIAEAKKVIHAGKHLLLFHCNEEALMDRLAAWIEEHHTENIVLWHLSEKAYHSECVRRITEEQMAELLDLYRLYEWSDRITVVEDAPNHGSLLNFLRNGLMNADELAEALLYKMV